MKELSKTGVSGVNLFGQVDDVDARGYLNAVDFEEFEEDDNPKRIRARLNVVTVVLVYDNVFPPPFSFFYGELELIGSRRIQRCCFRCFRDLLDDILQLISYDYRHSMQKICHLQLYQQSWHIVKGH